MLLTFEVISLGERERRRPPRRLPETRQVQTSLIVWRAFDSADLTWKVGGRDVDAVVAAGIGGVSAGGGVECAALWVGFDGETRAMPSNFAGLRFRDLENCNADDHVAELFDCLSGEPAR